MCRYFCTRGLKVKYSVSTAFCTQKPNGTFRRVHFFLYSYHSWHCTKKKTPIVVNRLMLKKKKTQFVYFYYIRRYRNGYDRWTLGIEIQIHLINIYSDSIMYIQVNIFHSL